MAAQEDVRRQQLTEQFQQSLGEISKRVEESNAEQQQREEKYRA